MTQYKYSKYIILAALSILPNLSFAQTSQMPKAASYNAALIGLLSLAIILLGALLILGNVVKKLAEAYFKMQKEKKNNANNIILSLALLLISSTAIGQEAVSEVTQPSSPFINGIPKFDFYFILSFIGLEIIVILALLLTAKNLIKILANKGEIPPVVAKKLSKISWLDKFNKSVDIKNEDDILLDHNYDGIKELDNDLPPWWKYGFYLTILIGVVYMWYYHMAGGPSQIDELNYALKKGEQEKAAYLANAANNIDENSVTLITDEAELSNAKTLFVNNCAACHAADGGGGVGPNFCDDYFLNGGSINDIFSTIKYGIVENGMKSWKDDFSPKQMAALASYVKLLQGTTPAIAKEPQGKLEASNNTEAENQSKEEAIQ